MSHPLHPALVHFPIACWSLATIADVMSPWWGKPAWQLAGVLMAIGLVTAIAAMASGFVELIKIDEANPALRDGNRHMLFVIAAWTGYATSLFLRCQGMSLNAPGTLAITISVAGFVCLGIAGWLGGKLVYQHGVGRTR